MYESIFEGVEEQPVKEHKKVKIGEWNVWRWF